ncbi:MAG: DegT/DnrJ/EryC1/StrS family aminotransferase [Ignavibacteriaceae bacterium]
MQKLAILGGKPVRSKPFTKWPIFGEEEISAVNEVFNSRAWGIGGTKVTEFQEKFAQMHNIKYGIATMNGTVALEVALKACKIGEGDEVIVPDYTFAATATSVLSVNAIPVFVDIDPSTFCIDPNKIIEAVTPRTKAIIAVHLGGQPSDMDAILQIANKKNLYVIEDAAQAHFAEWNSKKVGSIGHIAAFSFQSSKNITSGEGGIVVTNDEELAKRSWSYHNSGRRQGGEWYEHPYLGNNFRMTEFQAAILLAQLTRAQQQLKLRELNAQHLIHKLKNINGINTLKRDKRVNVHSYHIFIIKYEEEIFNGISRDTFVRALNSEGVPAIKGYIPLHREGFLEEVKEFSIKSENYAKRNYDLVSCPETERACRVSIWLPQYILLGTEKDIEDVAEAFEKVIDNINQL